MIKSGWDNLLEDVNGLHVHLHPGDVEGDPHPPGARGPVVGVELRLLSNIILIYIQIYGFSEKPFKVLLGTF